MATVKSAYPLNITSVILQSTSSNLKSLIALLTILDSILDRGVNVWNPIENNDKDVAALKQLFSSINLIKNILDTFIFGAHLLPLL